MLKDVKTCYPGRIVSFDPVTQLADVEIAIERFYSDYEGYFKSESRPPLQDLPVHFPRSRDFAMTFPIQVGDDCLICFAYRGYNHWIEEGSLKAGRLPGGHPAPQVFRINNINDAFVLVGFDSKVNAITDFNPNDLEIRSRDNTQKIVLEKGGKIVVENPSNDVDVNCVKLTVNASEKVDLQTPLLNVSGKIVGGSTATFADVTTSPNFIIGGGSYSINGLGLTNMVDFLAHYDNHKHYYYWTGSSGNDYTNPTT